jgi:molybdopterin-guanine dinucleotide biosynthesis protein A
VKGEKTGGPGEGICIAVPHVGGYHHPLAAAYRIEVLPEVRRLLAADRLRPVFLFESVPTRTIAAAELPDLDSLVNVNTPEEYEAVLRAVTEITTTELD